MVIGLAIAYLYIRKVAIGIIDKFILGVDESLVGLDVQLLVSLQHFLV